TVNLQLVLAKPAVPVATRQAYRWLAEVPREPSPSPDAMLQALATGSARQIASCLWNDFEKVILPRIAPCAQLKERLIELGALGALLCGSGSGVFGIFDTAAAAIASADQLRQEGWWAIQTAISERAIELSKNELLTLPGT
ncbi:MAG: hypothetical protein HY692_07175, partial [Cyanobacteria bacterium NC_groundwater_1444_Ag_S-0.65um_54_12]|nr:hypothetical protein [Cyanobacteria bacterium NC_groundwater_1444_Ag_S-0.65um_54_12]